MTRNYTIAFILACLSFLIRTQGIFLIIAIGIWLATQRKWKPLLILGGMAVATQLVIMDFWGGMGRYGKVFWMKDPRNVAAGSAAIGDLVERLTTNVVLYIKIIGEALCPLSAWHGLAIILGLVLVWVMVKGVKNDSR